MQAELMPGQVTPAFPVYAFIFYCVVSLITAVILAAYFKRNGDNDDWFYSFIGLLAGLVWPFTLPLFLLWHAINSLSDRLR